MGGWRDISLLLSKEHVLPDGPPARRAVTS
jgi:hypothetical protein